MEDTQFPSSSPSSDPAASVATASSTATPFSATSCPSATVAAAASTSTASRASAAFASTHFTACVQNCCSSPMCVVADEIEEDGSNDASGADGAKRQRVGDASGGASGFEDGGGVRNGDELSADDLTQLAACDDVGLDLTEKESALLVAKRRACATRERQHGLSAMQGAQLHGFRLVRRDGQVAVECLLCNKQFDAQSGRYFLNNYLNWHVGKDREHAQLAAAAREVLCSVSSAGAAKPFEAAEPPVNATPHVSVSLRVASGRTTRSGATFGAAVPGSSYLDRLQVLGLCKA